LPIGVAAFVCQEMSSCTSSYPDRCAKAPPIVSCLCDGGDRGLRPI